MKALKAKYKYLIIGAVCLLLLVSVGFNVWFAFFEPADISSYLQDENQIYVMEAGILKRTSHFDEGAEIKLSYDFDNSEYPKLLTDYGIESIAGSGSEFEKAKNLMNEFSARLTHKSDYDNHVDMNAISLLAYSLDNNKQGINCRNKAQILNEMCLALKIYARKVWILPCSEYDNDCHVVNEVYDTSLNKWIMLDVTNNEYWIDESGTPLSVLEIRQKGAAMQFCTPITAGESKDNPQLLKEKHIGDFLYIMKNMVYTRYCTTYTTGETEPLVLLPVGFEDEITNKISMASVLRSPLAE